MEFPNLASTASTVHADELLNALMTQNPAFAMLEPDSITVKENGAVEILMTARAKHTNIYGVVHGGVFVSMLDTAMGYACHLKKSSNIVTLNITTSFIANCRAGAIVVITARPVHAGRRIVVAESEARTKEGELLTTAQGTFFVLGEHPTERIKAPDTAATKSTGKKGG
jgi:acyl-CoA thioesterase